MTKRSTRLPEDITLTLDEAGKVLFALDVALERASERDELVQVMAARKLLTRKLWQDLGDLLDEAETDDGE